MEIERTKPCRNQPAGSGIPSKGGFRRAAARAALIAALFGLAGCGTANFPDADVEGLGDLALQQAALHRARPTALPTLKADDARPLYRVGPLDQITVVVWGRPDLGSQVPSDANDRRNVTTVDANGEIALAFLDRLKVSGLSLAEVNQAIADAYAPVISSPMVETEMVAFRSRPVQIEGEVERPGTVYLTDAALTLGEALARAGGVTDLADTRRVLLTRGGTTYDLNLRDYERGLNDDLDIILQTGDRVGVPSVAGSVFYVMGDVEAQGSHPIPRDGITLLEGLAAAGGLNMATASDHNLLLMRSTDGDTTVYKFNFFDAMAHEDIAMVPGDRIYVSRSRLGNFGDGWRNFVPFLSTFTAVYFIDRVLEEPN